MLQKIRVTKNNTLSGCKGTSDDLITKTGSQQDRLGKSSFPATR